MMGNPNLMENPMNAQMAQMLAMLQAGVVPGAEDGAYDDS